MSAVDRRPACGTYNGYAAHKRRNEPACQACKDGAAAYERKRTEARRLKRANGEPAAGRGRPRRETDDFIQEVEHLAVDWGEGWGRICAAFGLSPAALERRLMRHGRHDLAAHIFGVDRYEITQGQRQRGKQAA